MVLKSAWNNSGVPAFPAFVLRRAGSLKGVEFSMSQRFRPDPAEFERCVTFLCVKIEGVALRAGASDADCTDLEGTLTAMPPLLRDRARLMLRGIEIQTEYDEPVMALAARYVLRLAEDVWEANPHPLPRAAAPPRFLARSG